MYEKEVGKESGNMALFPGGSCYPFSIRSGETYNNPRDQLNMIFDVIGSPSREALEALGPHPFDFIATMEKKEPLAFEEKWPHASPEAVCLLKRMLEFSAFDRITVQEALESNFFVNLTRDTVTDSEPLPLHLSSLDQSQVREEIVKELKLWRKMC